MKGWNLRYKKPTAEEQRRQAAEHARVAKAAEAAKAAQAAAKGRSLNRSRANWQVAAALLGDDENVFFDDDCGVYDSLDEHHGSAQPGNKPTNLWLPEADAGLSAHGQRCAKFEQQFREHDELGVQYRIMRAPQIAEYRRQDLQQRLQLYQQRVLQYIQEAAQPNCTCSGKAQVVGWRKVLLRTMCGTGAISIPSPSCGCALFEMHPAAIDCHATSPVAAHSWLEGPLVLLHGLLEVEAGVAVNNFASVLSQYAEYTEQLQVQPRKTLPLVPKILGPALRHARVEQYLANSPARCGADIFSSSIGHCPPCAGAQLQQLVGADVTAGQQQSNQLLSAQAPLAAAREGFQTVAVVPAIGGAAPEAGGVGAEAAGFEENGAAGILLAIGAAGSTCPSLQQAPNYQLLPKMSQAQTWQYVLRSGVQAEQRSLSLSADGNAKQNHYGACGNAITAAYEHAGLQPQVSIYFTRAGELAMGLRGAAEQLRDDGDTPGDDVATCEANLTCSRETAKSGGSTVVDEKNISGGACKHNVPVCGTFMSSPYHEHFAQYVALLMVVLYGTKDQPAALPQVKEFVLDINCQFSKHLAKYFPNLAKKLRCYIGWLHAKAGHNLDCQLEFSAMFGDGLGRTDGEVMERIWAELKPVARIQRYQAKPHRILTLELALIHLASRKYRRSAELLVQTLRHTERRKSKLLGERDATLAFAAQQGFQLDPDARFEQPEQGAMKLTDPELYVKTLAARGLYESLTARGGSAVIAGLDSNTGRALAVQVNDPKYLPKLEADLKRLRRRLGISTTAQDWQPVDPQYQEAAEGLRTTSVRNIEVKVERHVSFLATLQEDRGMEVQSGHNTGLIRDKIRYRVRQIRELMAVWEAWQRFNQPPCFQLPAWEEADIFSNVLPWTAASAAQGLTEQHLRYRLYCITQELKRCEEELRFLPQDALNALQYYQHQRRLLELALAAQCDEEQQAETPTGQAMCQGRKHVLNAWAIQVGAQEMQAAKAFTEAGWIMPAST